MTHRLHKSVVRLASDFTLKQAVPVILLLNPFWFAFCVFVDLKDVLV